MAGLMAYTKPTGDEHPKDLHTRAFQCCPCAQCPMNRHWWDTLLISAEPTAAGACSNQSRHDGL